MQKPNDHDGDCLNHGKGFYAGTYSNPVNNDLQVFNFTAPRGSSCSEYPGYQHASDEFTFNVPDHVGKFNITTGGQTKVVSDEEIMGTIDPSSFPVQYFSNQVPVNSLISLTTPDGYIFHFGRNLNSLDYSFTCFEITRDLL